MQVLSNLGTSDIDQGLEERLVDGIIYAYQEQVCDGLSEGHLSLIHRNADR